MRTSAWWRQKRPELLAALGTRGSAFVYDRASIRAAAQALRALESVSRVHYSMKANPNPDILRLLHAEGIQMECVSRGEVERTMQLFEDLDRSRILFTPNFAPREEYEWAFAQGVRVTIEPPDALTILATYPDTEHTVLVRVQVNAPRGQLELTSDTGTTRTVEYGS